MKMPVEENHVCKSPVPKNITDSDKFPEGLRVLAVDDNSVCLRVLEACLRQCRYKVTKTTEAVNALKLLRENKNNFDIVITDVHMLDMDGFRLLEIIGLEMDIPVIMMSSNDDQATVMKGIEHGACDYLLKPVRLDVIKNIWQHVIRKSIFDANDLNTGKGDIKRISSKGKKRSNSQIKGKDLKEDDSNQYSDENVSTRRKPRVAWHQELHKKFIHACDKLGPDKAVPSKILEEMNEPNLTREKIASHLQKYRTALKKTGDQQKNNHIDCNGMNWHLPNAPVLSFNNQGSNGVNRLNGFRNNGPISSRTNQLGHHVQKPDAFGHSFVNPLSGLLLPNQPNPLSQQFPNNLEVVDDTCQRIPGHGPRDIYSNSARTENLYHQNNFKGPSHFFPSRTNLCNGVMEVSSRISGYNASNEPRPSSFPLLPGCGPNSFPVSSSFDFSDCAIFDDANLSKESLLDQNYSGCRTVQEIFPGPHEGIGPVHMDMQSSTVENPLEIEELPLGKDPFVKLDTDGFYHLSSCSSTDDDLNAVVKQFQQ